jgi:Fe2+ or Zn2+ uptake regulation protein
MQTQPDILRQSGLSVTDSRKKILDLFLATDGALAHADIEKNTSNSFDRVTVYRTLQTFVEKGIIHQIPTTDNSILYALCKHNCEQGHHHDDHVHFICSNGGDGGLWGVWVEWFVLKNIYQSSFLSTIPHLNSHICTYRSS